MEHGEVGPHVLLERLGRGASAEVFRALHRPSGMIVALKRFNRAPDALERRWLDAEVRAAASLRHPRIAALVDAELSGSEPYLSMELGDATLAQVPPVGFEAARDAVVDVLSGLAHAHARGVVHRDVKPSNLVWLRGRPALVDFGIARAGAGHGAAIHAGTPRYMAPEQRSGALRDQGPRADLFAVGQLLLEWLPGALTDPGFAALVAELLAEDPADRPRCAAEVALRLVSLGASTSGASTSSARAEATLVDPTQGSVVFVGPAVVARTRGPRRAAEPLSLGASWRDHEPDDDAPAPFGTSLYGRRAVRLCGRDAERDVLFDGLNRSLAGPVVVGLSGPAGVGKSRLAAYISELAAERGGSVLRLVHSDPPERFDGFAGALVRWADAEGLPDAALPERFERTLRLIGGHPDDHRDRLVALASGSTLSPSTRRGALAALLAAMPAPRVVWIDDAQWGADAVELALQLVGGDVGVMFVVTVRDDLEAPAAVGALLASGASRSVAVGPLPDPDARALAAELLGLDGPEVVRVAARCAGSPLFAIQLVGDWVSRGQLVAGPTGLRRPEPDAEPPLPVDLSAVWRLRLAALVPENERRLLHLAAVLGVEVDSAEWSRAALGAGLGEVPQTLLAPLLLRNLVVGTEERWRFAHGLLREALLSEASAIEPGAVSLHAAAAASLAEEPATAARRGRHLLASGDAERAFVPLIDGAWRENLAGRHVDSLVLLEEAQLALVRAGAPPADPRWGRLWYRHANLARNRGAWAEADRWIERVLAGAVDNSGPVAGWESHRVDALVHLAQYRTTMARYDEALELLDLVRPLARGLPTLESYGRVEVIAGQWLVDNGRFADAEPHLALALAHGVATTQCTAHDMRAVIALREGRFDDALAHTERSLQISARSGDTVATGISEQIRAAVSHVRGDLPAAAEHYRATLRVLGGATEAIEASANLAAVCLLLGRDDEALALVALVEPRARRIGWRHVLSYCLGVRWALSPDLAGARAAGEELVGLLAEIRQLDLDFVAMADERQRRCLARGDLEQAEVADAFSRAHRDALAAVGR
jgi:tetratricopeptide (TPR) repeat protein